MAYDVAPGTDPNRSYNKASAAGDWNVQSPSGWSSEQQAIYWLTKIEGFV
jgi:hypothetical protein